ncbi:hypothetical protein VPH35_022208 [Triticum aestivum]
MMQMKTTTSDGSSRIIRQPKIPTKMFLFIFKQKVGSLLFGKDHKIIRLKKMLFLCTGRWWLITMVKLGKINSWPVYMESDEIIKNLPCTIDDAIIKYRERRFEAGLFYSVPNKSGLFYLVPNKCLTFTVKNYLYGDSEFLRDLRRKKTLERTMRERKQQLYENRNLSSVAVKTLRLCGVRHVFYLLLLFSLSLMIVYL